jgi:hypothetical protein
MPKQSTPIQPAKVFKPVVNSAQSNVPVLEVIKEDEDLPW